MYVHPTPADKIAELEDANAFLRLMIAEAMKMMTPDQVPDFMLRLTAGLPVETPQ